MGELHEFYDRIEAKERLMQARIHSSVRFAIAMILVPTIPCLAESEDSVGVALSGLRGLHFVPNEGQWSDPDTHLGLYSQGMNVAFHSSSLSIHPLTMQPGETAISPIQVGFAGANTVVPEGRLLQPAKFNFFVRRSNTQPQADVSSFRALQYENLYDDIDLQVIGTSQAALKYQFYVKPGADWEQIQIEYTGIEQLRLTDEGDVEIVTPYGTLRDKSPRVWQLPAEATPAEYLDGTVVQSLGEIVAGAEVVPARYEIINDRTIRIAIIGECDTSRPLLIDPELDWMSFFGGSNADQGHDIAVSSRGTIAVTGHTVSVDFAGRQNSHHGDTDAFVMKLNSAGALQWVTFVGGSGSDHGKGITLDGTDRTYLTGFTSSPDFEGRTNDIHGEVDAFVSRLSPGGHVDWATYLGGTLQQYGEGIAVINVEDTVVTGYTDSPDFEGRINAYFGGRDAFAARLSATGDLVWMRYLGGSGNDFGRGIVQDPNGDLLVGGHSASPDFEGRINGSHGRGDAVCVKLTASGELLWMSYFGGAGVDDASDIVVDVDGKALLAGSSSSRDFEGRRNDYHGGDSDAYVLKCRTSGQIEWALYCGGSAADYAHAIAIDDAGHTYLTGHTLSMDFTGRDNANHGGVFDPFDAFVLKVHSSSRLRWMSYLGGSADDSGRGVAVDALRAPLITGFSNSTNFEGQNNSYYGGSSDSFVVKVTPDETVELSALANCPGGGAVRIEWSGATPNGQVALLFARSEGSFTIPQQQPCAGTRLALGANQIQVAFQGGAGSGGSRTINGSAGAAACGGYLQLLDATTCGLSNVARLE